jgi:hypothetical protein
VVGRRGSGANAAFDGARTSMAGLEVHPKAVVEGR